MKSPYRAKKGAKLALRTRKRARSVRSLDNWKLHELAIFQPHSDAQFSTGSHVVVCPEATNETLCGIQ